MLIGYFEYLKERLEKVEVKGDVRSFSYYTCGQNHDHWNRDWKPFQHLEAYCKEKGLNPAGVRDMIENRTGRRVVCECQFLSATSLSENDGAWDVNSSCFPSSAP